jgi:hypothetical protein
VPDEVSAENDCRLRWKPPASCGRRHVERQQDLSIVGKLAKDFVELDSSSKFGASHLRLAGGTVTYWIARIKVRWVPQFLHGIPVSKRGRSEAADFAA